MDERDEPTNTATGPIGPPCAACGTRREWVGPPDVLENLGPICPACNADALAEWRRAEEAKAPRR